MYQHDFILIDRSGSMSNLWEEALSSVNAYVKNLAKDNVDTGVTVALFDSSGGKMRFEVIRDRITPNTFKPLSNKDGYYPEGLTPLSDATGKIVALAEAGNYDKVSIVIMTDGHENDSREFSVEDAKAALERCKKKDWAVTFLGANFQNVQQAASYGINLAGSVSTSARGLTDTFTTLSKKRAVYASASIGDAAENTMSWTPDEQEEALKK